MKKRLFLSFILLHTFLVIGFTQNEKISLRDKIYFGGNIALAFGSETQIEIAPYVGYRFTPKWSVGVGGSYNYYKTSRGFGSFSTSLYGGNIFTKYTLFHDFPAKGMSIFTHAEYEALSLEKKYFREPFNEDGRFIMHSFLIGAGLRQYLGGRASMEVLVLFNLNQTKYSPYQNPVIKVGINF
jgi:hypothetical protein